MTMKEMAIKFAFQQSANNVHKLYIYDEVTALGDYNWETWKRDDSETSAKYFSNALEQIPDNAEIELYVKSNGGSVEEGTAIYSMLKRHKAHKTCYIDGAAHSIAFVICMSCDKIIMGEGAMALVHNIWMWTYGNAEQLRKVADDLEAYSEANRKIFMKRAKNLTEDELIEMMNKETYLTPDQCLEYGFIDEIADREIDTNSIEQSVMQKIQQLQQQIKNQQEILQAITNSQQATDTSNKQEKNKQELIQKASKILGAFCN